MDNEKRSGHLTNEKISKRFKSQFDLVNHSIRLASHYIQAGIEPSPGSADNIVNDVLSDIEHGRDTYQDIDEDPSEEEEVVDVAFSIKEEVEEITPKKSRSRAKEALKK